MRISDWSSDVCSSDLADVVDFQEIIQRRFPVARHVDDEDVLHFHVFQWKVVQYAVGRGQERSEECRVGKVCASTCRSRSWPFNKKITTFLLGFSYSLTLIPSL